MAKDLWPQEQSFLDFLREKYPSKKIDIVFTEGDLGLENMTFPYWTIKVTDEDGTTRKKEFDDQLRYSRQFGDTGFHDHPAHREAASEFIEEK
jgi:hypothetical protein